MHIRINDFAGTFPKLHRTKLPDHAAQSCKNVMIDHGVLSPSNDATLYHESGQTQYREFLSAMFFKHNAGTYKKFSDKLAAFAFSPVHDSFRLYWTTEQGVDEPLRFSDWDIASDDTLTTDGFTYLAGMPTPNMSGITVAGIIPAPDSPEDVPSEPEAPTTPTPPPPTIADIAPILKRKFFKWSGLFQKVIIAANNSANEKKEPEISDAITEEIIKIEQQENTEEARIYAFSYVNRFGDESAPGIYEEVLYIKDGDKPVIEIAYSADEREVLVRDHAVAAIRMYRSVTNSVGSAQLLFVKEEPFYISGDTLRIIDDIPRGSLELGEPIVTVNYDPPRKGMRGLGVTDYGVGYAYVGKTVCLSEPYTLYAWPRFYEISTQNKIMGMGHYDNTIVVATTGSPLLISGVDPEGLGVMSLPLYEGCVSPRSMVNLNHGCMYASENGLVLVTTNSAKLLTDGVFSTEDWQKINPSSIHASAYKGGYLFFWKNGSEQGCGYIDLNNPSAGVLWFDDYALNTFDNNGSLQMINKSYDALNRLRVIHKTFNPEHSEPFSNKKFVWRSKEFNLDTPRRLLAAQVIADSYGNDSVIFKVYADGALMHESIVKNARPFRIVNHSARRDFSIEIESSTPVREMSLGETMRDMLA